MRGAGMGQRVARGGSLAVDEVLNFGEELRGVAEAAEDGGIAEECDFIELLEFAHDFVADDGCGDFALIFALDFLHDVIHQQLNLRCGNGALDDGVGHGGHQFFAREVFASSVALEDNQRWLDDFFVGGEAVAAFGAHPPAGCEKNKLYVVCRHRRADGELFGSYHFVACDPSRTEGAAECSKR